MTSYKFLIIFLLNLVRIQYLWFSKSFSSICMYFFMVKVNISGIPCIHNIFYKMIST